MPPRPARNRLQLGPIVGHTDDTSAKVWIQAFDDPQAYILRVAGGGSFPFRSTENGVLEFCTGVARAEGLRSDRSYRYSVVRDGRRVTGATGTFRTMPEPSSPAPIVFCAISCNKLATDGAWKALRQFIEDAQPAFLLLMGDQVYIDEDEPNVFEKHYGSDARTRRRALAEKYRLSWDREAVRWIFANLPTYMIWDDHESRDGWGSLASDSRTLLPLYPRGARIFARARAFFEDCRDVYWHFQGCRNPLQDDIPDPTLPNYIVGSPAAGASRAMPFVFRCGRVAILVLDSRGERDVFRKELPILGAEQWQFIDLVLENLRADIDAIAIVTPTPIASLDPEGQSQRLVGGRTDDVEAFRRGDENGVLNPDSSAGPVALVKATIGARLSRTTGWAINLGNFKVSNIDEARDQWAHALSRPEQRQLLMKAARARFTNRTGPIGRELIFLSGDIHIGCIFDIAMSDPAYTAVSLTSSGISAKEEAPASLFVGSFIDEDFEVTDGIRSTLREVVPDYNFGVVQILPTGLGAEVTVHLAHKGNAFAAGMDISGVI